ncbi:MAG: PhoH family protein [Acidobacteria bacterium]|nr:PhoH family protein [Acidobacteriota bacterium]MBU4495273.1 PhoH family protein [Acidobacteriota bacterium]
METIEHPTMSTSAFSGVLDSNLKKLENRLDVQLFIRGNRLMIDGAPDKVAAARNFFEKVLELGDKGCDLKAEDFTIALDLLENGMSDRLENYRPSEALTFSRKSVTPKTLNQNEYMKAIKTHDLVFGIGPAGTGKTYLAMAMALALLQEKLFSRIILTRPAVEAGEKLGFLPGDLQEKINPYLRPLYDALFDLSRTDQAQRLIERGFIEIAPLAFMRGRTLNNAFIILDEAQNTTKEQMKMLLTRPGAGSKLIVTADITQIDLPQPEKSGVLHAMQILKGIEEITFIRFNDKDVVRHPLVRKIIKAYEKAEAKKLKTT